MTPAPRRSALPAGAGASPPATGRRRRLRRRLATGLAVCLATVLAVGLLRLTTPLQVAEWKSYDLRLQAVADAGRASPDIVVIEIDDNSMERYRDVLGRWPWSRDVYEALLTYLHAAEARLAVFDVLFPDADLSYPVGDTIFAEALAYTGLGILGFTLSPGSLEEALEWERSLEAAGAGRAEAAALLDRFRVPEGGADPGGTGGSVGGQSAPSAPPRAPGDDLPYAEAPHPLFLSAARGAGSVVLNPDPDGVARRDRPVYRHRGALFPSLALAAARALEPERFGGDVSFENGALRVGDARVPVDARGRMLLRFHGPYRSGGETTYATYPVFRVLASFEQLARGMEPELPLETFRDKIVVVGVTAVGATEFDVRPTPVSAMDPGLLIHITALDNLLHGDLMRRAGVPANLALLSATALAAGLLASAAGSVTAGALGTLLLLVLVAAGTTWGVAAGLWIDTVPPLLAGFLAFAGGMAASYATEGREKRRVRDMFSRYVPPEYVSRLADDLESLTLGGERVPITILFSDIRGFTSLSERLPAQEVVELLNEYLDRMAEVVFRHGGTLDKFIGDAVMAFWGAPLPTDDHARRAVDAALDMVAELEDLNGSWEARGLATRMAIGIGINTGDAIVGNIGSLSRKLDYTAIGDPVNLASRLESLNKGYGTTLLVSESTAEALGEAYQLRHVEAVTVKGKTRAVNVYEVEGRKQASGNDPRLAGAPASAGALLAAGLLLLSSVAGLEAQQPGKARWTDWVYSPGAWAAGRLVTLDTPDPDTDSLALVARAEVYSLPPRWRVEVARVTDGRALAAPVVIVEEGRGPVVLTAVGSAPFADHAAAQDPVILRIVEGFGPDGRPRDPAPARLVTLTGSGNVDAVVLRQAVARADFDDALLGAGTAGRLGRSLGRFGAESLAGERDSEVTASAGARGVTRVRTVSGEIVVTPDTAAVRRMEAVGVDILELERFLRELRSAPAAAPTPGDSRDVGAARGEAADPLPASDGAAAERPARDREVGP